jgi:hypothetical protein
MQVHAYLEHAFSAGRLQQMSAALAKPALHTCLRVNTQDCATGTAIASLDQQLQISKRNHLISTKCPQLAAYAVFNAELASVS